MRSGVNEKRLFATAAVVLAGLLARTTLAGNPEDDAFRVHYGTSESLLGLALAPAGDMNGDGVADYIIGAPMVSFFAGSVHVISGADGSDLRTINGNSGLSFFGFAISRAGDVDGDGYEDIVIGAPIHLLNNFDPMGAVYVYSGHTGQLIFHVMGADSAGVLGWAVAGCGDVNGDGYADIAVSAPEADIGGTNNGAVYIFAGPDGALLRTFAGSGGAQLGLSLANTGDVNGDGFDDLLAGMPGANKARLLNVHDGTVIRTLTGDDGGDFGWAVADAGDVNGDGTRDQIVGAPYANGGGVKRGQASVFNGADGSLLYTMTGDNKSEFGYAVAGGADVDGDGNVDIVVGAPSHRTGTFARGQVEIHSGPTGELVDVINGGPLYGYFGEAVAVIGDVTAEGVADVLVGQSFFGGLNSGAAFVFKNTPPVFAMAGGNNSMTLLAHPSFVLAADINNDGAADAITVHPESNKIAIRRSKGDGTFYASQFYNAGAHPVTVAACDIDQDGDLDLVVAGEKLVFLRRVGNAFVPSGSLQVGHKPSSIAAADFNHDGRIDLAVANRLDGTVTVLINNGRAHLPLSREFKHGVVYQVGANPVHIQAGMLDGDAYPDLAVADNSSNQISTLINRQDGRFFPQCVTATQEPPSCLALADFNADGVIDLACIGHDSDFVSVRDGTNDGYFGDPQYFGVGHAPAAIVATDMDGNGRPDLAVTCNGDSCVSLLLNDQQGGFASWPGMSTANGPVWISSDDLDGDGDRDLVTVSDYGFITVLMNLWF